MIKVGVIGHTGRMGSEVCRAVEADPDLALTAKVGRSDSPTDLEGCDVAVEFSTPKSVRDNVLWCVEHGIDTVVGATGLGEDDLDNIRRLVDQTGTSVFVAPNFALGAVMMMSFAAKAAPYFLSAEIVERHHENKADAPSGTALRTAALMNEARKSPWPVTPESRESVAGSRGGEAGGVRVHSLRLPGSVAHQEVVLGGRGETLTIRHDSLDRSSFMPGVILAIKRVNELEGVTVGLEHLLDL